MATATLTDPAVYSDPDAYKAACESRRAAALATIERTVAELRPQPARSVGLEQRIAFLRETARHAADGDEELAARLLIRVIVSSHMPFVPAMLANAQGPLQSALRRLKDIEGELDRLAASLADDTINVNVYEANRDRLTVERDHLTIRAQELSEFLGRWPVAIRQKSEEAVGSYPGGATDLANDLAAVLADAEPPRMASDAERELDRVAARLANIEPSSRLGTSLARRKVALKTIIANDAAARSDYHAANAKALVDQLVSGDATAFGTLERFANERPEGFAEDWLETLQTALEAAIAEAGARIGLAGICPN